MSDNDLFRQLDHFLQLNYIEIDSDKYYQQIHQDEAMKRMKIQSRLRLKRVLPISEFSLDKATFYYLLRKYNVHQKPLTQLLRQAKADQYIIDKIKTEVHYKPPSYILMRLLILLNLNEMEAKNLLSEAEMTFRPYQYLDLIVLFALRHQIYDLVTINQLLTYKNVVPSL